MVIDTRLYKSVNTLFATNISIYLQQHGDKGLVAGRDGEMININSTADWRQHSSEVARDDVSWATPTRCSCREWKEERSEEDGRGEDAGSNSTRKLWDVLPSSVCPPTLPSSCGKERCAGKTCNSAQSKDHLSSSASEGLSGVIIKSVSCSKHLWLAQKRMDGNEAAIICGSN